MIVLMTCEKKRKIKLFSAGGRSLRQYSIDHILDTGQSSPLTNQTKGIEVFLSGRNLDGFLVEAGTRQDESNQRERV